MGRERVQETRYTASSYSLGRKATAKESVPFVPPHRDSVLSLAFSTRAILAEIGPYPMRCGFIAVHNACVVRALSQFRSFNGIPLRACAFVSRAVVLLFGTARTPARKGVAATSALSYYLDLSFFVVFSSLALRDGSFRELHWALNDPSRNALQNLPAAISPLRVYTKRFEAIYASHVPFAFS